MHVARRHMQHAVQPTSPQLVRRPSPPAVTASGAGQANAAWRAASSAIRSLERHNTLLCYRGPCRCRTAALAGAASVNMPCMAPAPHHTCVLAKSAVGGFSGWRKRGGFILLGTDGVR
uniref:Uncharacterized protein n=1 Tax=Chlamydomonas euryale TaxID=1486919 RepID=A0A7R9V039_9CHLO